MTEPKPSPEAPQGALDLFFERWTREGNGYVSGAMMSVVDVPAHRVGVLWLCLCAFGLLWVCGANDLITGRRWRGLILCGVGLLCFAAGITANLW